MYNSIAACSTRTETGGRKETSAARNSSPLHVLNYKDAIYISRIFVRSRHHHPMPCHFEGVEHELGYVFFLSSGRAKWKEKVEKSRTLKFPSFVWHRSWNRSLSVASHQVKSICMQEPNLTTDYKRVFCAGERARARQGSIVWLKLATAISLFRWTFSKTAKEYAHSFLECNFPCAQKQKLHFQQFAGVFLCFFFSFFSG